jgi:predicted nucleotidyltransferase
MPTTAAIICEYNPFHRGHLRQLTWLRETLGPDTAVVCAMSGNYVQRGAPALFDKYTRAAAAIDCGADVVLELPPCVALRSAEGYAAGAVDILDRLGGVDVLCFGSETGDSAALERTADLLLSDDFPAALRAQLDTGVSFAAARAAAVAALGGDRALLDRPNDILAVEYCKALRRSGSAMQPLAIRRGGDYHAVDADRENPSATAVRALFTAGDDGWRDLVPPAAAERFAAAVPHDVSTGERAMLAILRTLPDAAFAALPFGGEGLWKKLMDACRAESSLEAILAAAKSKRYARTRLQRMVLCACLGLDKTALETPPDWVRLLGLSGRGREVLRNRNDAFCLISGGNGPAGALSRQEQVGDDLYMLFAADYQTTKSWARHSKSIYFKEKIEKALAK